MKRPAFQFYPSDWRNDAGLKLCSLGARGLWIEMICIMHASEPYGHLCAAGRPLDAKDLSKLVGEAERDIKKWLDELIRNNVCTVDEGVIVSRRMVRDEILRERRAAGGEEGSKFGHLGAEHGKKGGRPRKDTGDKKPPLEPPPSSSSSSSSSLRTNTPNPTDVGLLSDVVEKKKAISLSAFLEDCKQKGIKPVRDYAPLWKYVESINLPIDFIALAWAEFRRKFLPDGSEQNRKYKDWRKAFFNYVEGNYLKIWYIDANGNYELTTQGKQAEKFQDGSAA